MSRMRGRRLLGSGSAMLALGAILVLGVDLPHGSLPAGLTATPVQFVARFADLPSGLMKPVEIPAGTTVTAGSTLKAQPRSGAGVLVYGSTQQLLINRDRAAAGRAPLTWSGCLATVAVANARRMVAQGYISHTNGPWQDLGCRLGAQAGENVGWWSAGVDDAQLNAMFMASADHRANIMGPYHYVATAWAVAPNGYAYIAVEFA